MCAGVHVYVLNVCAGMHVPVHMCSYGFTAPGLPDSTARERKQGKVV